MKINELYIEALSIELNIPFSIEPNYFNFKVDKRNGHSFEVEMLKNGQYVCVSVVYANNIYSIEHIEFYIGESEIERLEVLTEILEKLKKSDSRVLENRNKLETGIQVELFEKNQWSIFGYPGKKINKNLGTQH